MPALQRLSREHTPALLAFEQDNRAYFAASVPDRGDAFFAEFDERLQERLAEQDAGECHFHVLVDSEGAVLGRVNLVDVADGEAELGYRIAKSASGRGLATAAVRQVCALAAEQYGLRTLRAVTTLDNPASQTVLTRTGFTVTHEIVIDDAPGLAYRKTL
ncbi:GNAT family N-acetyltransferase [Streptomyces sp. TRM66268-LWL]|uniref:GNAT family N-acetyltransferase n=1 Tax=Streptomyces polyasparticus TaxID=2767826 RepID=A0ABR7SL81_9ACTN|nr:GNAT family N-acetyltransferase [Streptomyces polyasparticus]MBC9715103.1 GNAT family N-acetyltransferase [Streptomyces polyasparticus]